MQSSSSSRIYFALNMNLRVLHQFLVLSSLWCSIQPLLIYPASSVLQITVSLSAPIDLPGRKLFWDWGLQMNYDLPFNVTQIYNAPIWPGKSDDRRRRDLGYQHENNASQWYAADVKYKTANAEAVVHPSDFTAGELYHSFENILVSYGFHETCLLRSVCELARHPFSDDQQNILTEMLTFLLTPSIHNGFSSSEALYREAYEEAERWGFLHYNCSNLYHECKQDLLTSITNVATNFNRD